MTATRRAIDRYETRFILVYDSKLCCYLAVGVRSRTELTGDIFFLYFAWKQVCVFAQVVNGIKLQNSEDTGDDVDSLDSSYSFSLSK